MGDVWGPAFVIVAGIGVAVAMIEPKLIEMLRVLKEIQAALERRS